MPTLISNENYAIRWDKTGCDNYTITNLLDEYNAHVTITDKTGTWVEEFDLTPSGSNTVILPGDGVFEICAYLFDIPIEVNELDTTFGKLSVCGYSLGSTVNLNLLSFIVDLNGVQTTISESGDFTNPPTSLQNFINAIQTYVTANGGGTVTLLLPGQSIPNLVPSTTGYQIVVQATDVYLVSTSGVYGIGPLEVTNDSNLYCSYKYIFPETHPIVFSLVVLGNEIIPSGEYYDMSIQADIDALILLTNTELGANGYSTGSLYNFTVNTITDTETECTLVTLQNGKFGPGETQCDFIYEFCDLYACLSRLMNSWLCQDPCADKCTAAGESYEEARRKAVELSTMFFHALMPLVTTDRLWYLGNGDISDQRLCNVNNILELYKKMRDYVKNCGFDCGCGCPDNCSDCQPCNGYSYAPSPSNPSTPCGCK